MPGTSWTEESFSGLRWRLAGPFRGGRVVAVAGHPTDPMVFYFGAVAGGVWKTEDGGTYWENISDGFLNTSSIGALAVSPSDPNVIYAGTGETTIRTDVSYGDGVYRSTDGGKTWKHLGLEETRHIGEIRIHPQDPDLVYVAALGHAFGPNPERGVYRSRDGGAHWEHVLFQSPRAGAVDLAMDATNPRILFATVWQTHRHFWELSSGGPDSTIYRSDDGGDTWTDIGRNKGLPKGILGKVGITVSPARPQRVWAIIEAEKGGVYRSEDGGETWERSNGSRDLLNRPWYYCHIFADPQDPDTVWVTNLSTWKSTDGGRNFSRISTPHGDDHDMWFDPADPQRMIQGNDGGACVSFNGGATWSTIYNQPTAQIYRIDVDHRFPYRIYGTQQDNSSIAVPSATEYGAIPWGMCYAAGTGESGYIAVHPENPDLVYVGAVGSSPGGGAPLQRYDRKTRQIRLVTVWPDVASGRAPADLKYRFNWTFPILFSPHDPGLLYAAGNRVFRSRDEGSSWQLMSPDLSRRDRSKLVASGGPLTKDTSGAEVYATVATLAESPLVPGLLWAGTDDGLVHVTRDGGENWREITPPGVPEWSLISRVEASPHDPATAYVAATRYKLDEYDPYLYVTHDYGETWHDLGQALPRGEITRVIREDPVRPGLLYVGTETGVFVSLDSGESWFRLRNNLPVAPIYDLKVKDGDLVAATHGRSIWILDDVTPLREAAGGDPDDPAALLPPRTTTRMWLQWGAAGGDRPDKNYILGLGMEGTYRQDPTDENEPRLRGLDVGENPPRGVIVYYYLSEVPSEDLSLTVLDAEGNEIKTFNRKDEGDEAPADDGNGDSSKKERYPDGPRRGQPLRLGPVLSGGGEICRGRRRQGGGHVRDGRAGNLSSGAEVGGPELDAGFPARQGSRVVRHPGGPGSPVPDPDPDPGQGVRNPPGPRADRPDSGAGEAVGRPVAGGRSGGGRPGSVEPGGWPGPEAGWDRGSSGDLQSRGWLRLDPDSGGSQLPAHLLDERRLLRRRGPDAAGPGRVRAPLGPSGCRPGRTGRRGGPRGGRVQSPGGGDGNSCSGVTPGAPGPPAGPAVTFSFPASPNACAGRRRSLSR